MITQINLHALKAKDVSVSDLTTFGQSTVAIRIGEISVFINDTAVLDALHEAVTRAYELLAEGLVAS